MSVGFVHDQILTDDTGENISLSSALKPYHRDPVRLASWMRQARLNLGVPNN